MIELPVCRWRGPEENGRYPCRSHKLIAPWGVTPDLCQRCPYQDHAEQPPADYQPTEPPPLTEQVANFSAALQRWNAAGRPLVSLEVLAERRAACAACEFRNVDNDSCGVCGCPLSQPPLLGQALAVLTTGHKTASKTEMATERCPLGEPDRQEPYRSLEPRWLEVRAASP